MIPSGYNARAERNYEQCTTIEARESLHQYERSASRVIATVSQELEYKKAISRDVPTSTSFFRHHATYPTTVMQSVTRNANRPWGQLAEPKSNDVYEDGRKEVYVQNYLCSTLQTLIEMVWWPASEFPDLIKKMD